MRRTVLVVLHIVFVPYSAFSIFVAFTGGTDAGFILLFTWPMILVSLILLTLDGVLMLGTALRPRTPMSKRVRIMLGVGAILPLLPPLIVVAFYCTSQIAGSHVANRVQTPISRDEAKQLIESCKVQEMMRTPTAMLQLRAESLNFFEKHFGRFDQSGYRLFDPSDYDELLTVIRSPAVRTGCDHIYTDYLTDKEYQKLPSATKWVTATEVEELLQACAIDELHYGSPPHEIATYNPPRRILFYKVIEPTGPYTHVYTEFMTNQKKDQVFELARTQQSRCEYGRPRLVLP